jgi:hypothetical protein
MAERHSLRASRPKQHSRVAPTVEQLVRQVLAVSIEPRHNRPALDWLLLLAIVIAFAR